MKFSKTFTHCALCIAVVTAPAVADETRTTAPAPAAPAALDVALQSGGVLRGVALTTAAKPMANADVRIQFGPHIVARTRTKADGSFAIKGLRGGLHTVRVNSQVQSYRLWTAKTAPKSAVKVLAVNGSDTTVRGQYVPPIDLPVLVTGLAALGIGLVIGKQIGDDNGGGGGGSAPASP